MKKRIEKKRKGPKSIGKQVLSVFLSLSIAIGGLALPAKAEAQEALVNIAPGATASTSEGAYGGNVIQNVNDGNASTQWQTAGIWPSTAVLQLDGSHNLSKVVVKIGGASGEELKRSVNVTVRYAQNGITSDLITFGTRRSPVNADAELNVDIPVSASHVYVSLSEPQDTTTATPAFWPVIKEIEVYEKQDVSLSAYSNIADEAMVSTTGSSNGSEANLTDGNPGTLYKFHNAAMSSEKEIVLSYGTPRAMDAFGIAFEHVGAADGIDFAFRYSILARNGSGEYDTIVANASANRTAQSSQQYKFMEKTYSEVKIVMHSCTTNGGKSYGWPAVAEFEIYGSAEAADDSRSIAWGKPVHASSGKSLAQNVTDGSVTSSWRGSYYPAYVDIDLEKNYNLNTVEVFTPEIGYSQYTIYTSMDGRDFDKLAEKTGRESASPETGEVYQADGKEARIVRVYLEYNSKETAAVINEVRVTGTESTTPVQETPPVNTAQFSDTDYAVNAMVTDAETYSEVNGIIERRLGAEYKNWFTLELAENPKAGHDYDYYELSMTEGKVHVKGNDGVSLATGINHYLKYYCNVNVSQVGDQVTMPVAIPAIDGTVFKETKAEVRYSYNYCTLSYSMAFWGEQEWRNELDWLALNGVNVVLDATGQEEVWRRFLGKLGYEHEDIKDFIAGPAYYAWAYMANLSGFGGPVHDSWFEERTELARKNQEIMRNLGMQPVLQGYSGMVPTDIQDYDPDAQIIQQGTWCSFQRPAMLVTTSATFDQYAAMFYECQTEVYGATSDYYATDPFHEGGRTGSMSSTDISKEVLTSMLSADKDAVWIIQAWQGNPTTALLNGLDAVANGSQHALILDLYAEKTPHYAQTGGSYGDTDEFDDTPWLFCMLNNFGGRLGLHGHLDNLANNIPAAFNRSEQIAGIGITPEASVNNPVLYDFLFETVWQSDATQNMEAVSLDTWLKDYAKRRYGAESESAYEAWLILQDTVYKSSFNNLGQGAPESVVNARPALSIGAASTWGNAVVSYDKAELERAAALLLEDYDSLKNSEGYQYDVVTVLQQILSNSAQEYQKKMAGAFNAKDVAGFEAHAGTFMSIIDKMEEVTSANEYYLLGRWVEQAKSLGANADDFSKELYEFNAKALVTTWGSFNQAETGGLKDYSNRQWSGLIKDFYKIRWQRWINARTNELKGAAYESSINWFQWEWEWVRSNSAQGYTTAPAVTELSALGAEVLEQYGIPKNPAANAAYDLALAGMTATAGSEQAPGTNNAEGPAKNVLDNDNSTIWHSAWSGADRNNLWIDISLGESKTVNGLRMLPRNGGGNGVITQYQIQVSNDNGATYQEAAAGSWVNDASWKWVQFDETEATNVRLYAVNSYSNQSGKNFASAAEIRITAPPKAERAVTGVMLDTAAKTMTAAGETFQLTATVTPADAANKNVTWISANTAVATVSATGLVTAVSDGTAVIEAVTEDGSKKAACTVTVAVKKLTPTESFIQRLYSRVFGRAADDDGMGYYTELLASGERTGAEVGRGFIDSPEFAERALSNADYVEVLYSTFMNRASDEGGKAYWLNFLDNGVSRDFVFKGFVESAEFTEICASYGISRGSVELVKYMDKNPALTMFTNRLYAEALGRAGEEEGLEYYTKEITLGNVTPVQAAKNFIFSSEFEDKKLGNEAYVKVLYKTFMGREYDVAGLEYHLDRMRRGTTREEILMGFADSPEFETIMSTFGL